MYVYPEPEDLISTPLLPETARWLTDYGYTMAFLPYEGIRSERRPRDTLLEFLESADQNCASLAGWDIQALSREQTSPGRAINLLTTIHFLNCYTVSMHDIPQRIVDVLLELEAEMRKLGWWEEKKPSAKALASQQPFCMDQLAFEQWLQWVFLPRMKTVIEAGDPLPTQSGIFVYAEECLRHHGNRPAHLLALIKRFDELVMLQATQKRH